MQRSRSIAAILVVIAATAFAGCKSSPPATDSTSSNSDASSSQRTASDASGPIIEIVNQVVETSCGECQFEMEGTSCDLAVRIDGVAYFVDGFGIDDLGDAHAADGLCNAIRQARVTGRIENGRFIATAFELLPEE